MKPEHIEVLAKIFADQSSVEAISALCQHEAAAAVANMRQYVVRGDLTKAAMSEGQAHSFETFLKLASAHISERSSDKKERRAR